MLVAISQGVSHVVRAPNPPDAGRDDVHRVTGRRDPVRIIEAGTREERLYTWCTNVQVRLPDVSRAGVARMLREGGRYLGVSLVAALVALPVALEQAVEDVRFRDAVGTLPVEMSLCHQGRSTLETGILGDLHWAQTGAYGLGVRARVTEPPQAGATLASYADRSFVRANLEFIDDPDEAIARYTAEFRSRIVRKTLVTSVAAGLVGGLLVVVLLRRRGPAGETKQHRRVVLAAVAVGAVAVSSGAAVLMFDRWPCNQGAAEGLAFPGVPELRFSSPQTLELARQIQPFIEKNTERIRERNALFQAAAESTFSEALERRGTTLDPRDGEVIVLAEADPQGSYVGTEVRTALVEMLLATVGREAVVMRTISGDVTSNGTVAEDAFVEAEAAVGGELPTVAVAGDHDAEITQGQMVGHGMVVPDLDSEEVAGLTVSGANDVEHKALFGALVTNDSGLTEQELGARLRDVVSSDEAGIVLLHQPDAVAGYLGLDDLSPVRELDGSLTVPYDDGIPDVPPGTVSIGHLHDREQPWVLWNTEGEEVTWTVVDQLGTSGGAEEAPTFNRFSTPVSIPLKELSMRLQYFDETTGLQTGFATLACTVAGRCTVSDRTDVGLPLS